MPASTGLVPGAVVAAVLAKAKVRLAFGFILNGKLQQHLVWMTRSFGIGPLIFLEARVIFWLLGREHLTPSTVETVVWLCTGSSIFVADVLLHIQESLRGRQAKAKLPIAAAVSQSVQI